VEHAADALTPPPGAVEPAVADGLFAALYSDLHRMARRQLARGGRDMTLGTTTLLHEAYLDMAARDSAFPDRGRFMAYACRVMRTLIIDHVRNRKAVKRGGRFQISSLEADVAERADEKELTRISEALDELATVEPALAEIVDLKFFCGFSFGEIAAMRGLSERTVRRSWEKARIYLHGLVQDGL
jgi:RNA polymerase sigma factor (TIGR02999 family)